MSTRTTAPRARLRLGAALAAVFALVMPTYVGVGAAWGDDPTDPGAGGSECDTSIPVAGQVQSSVDMINGTDYSIVANTQMFKSQLVMDPTLSDSFDVWVEGTNLFTKADVTDKPNHNDYHPLGWDQNVFDFKYNKLGNSPTDAGGDTTDIGAWAVAFGDRSNTEWGNTTEEGVQAAYAAAKEATITVDYGVVGTYAGSPVRMRLVVTDIEPMENWQTVTVDHNGVANNGPIFQFASDPAFGVYFQNVHSAKFDIQLTDAKTGQPLQVDDIYLTQSSLSYWSDRGVREQTKPLSEIKQVYYSENSNILTETANQRLIDFVDQEGAEHEGFFTPFSGEKKEANGYDYDDHVGAQTFPRNAVTFQYADTSHMDFQNSSSSNTMWFTLYPQALTNQTPPNPEKTVYTEAVKGVWGSDEVADDLPEGGVRAGSDITFTIEQQVNELNHNSLVRYQSFEMTDTVPSEVEITGYKMIMVRTNEDGTTSEEEMRDAWGEWTSTGDGNTYTYTFDPGWMMQLDRNGMPMEGETYKMVLTGKVKDDATGAFENQATSIINGVDSDDPCVNNHFATNNTEMNIVSKTQEEKKLTNRDEEFVYTINARVPEDAITVEITDELADVLQIVGSPKVTSTAAEDKEGDARFFTDIDGNKLTLIARDPSYYQGEEITVAITARVKDSATEEELAQYIDGSDEKVPNTAELAFGNHSSVTNKVKVVIPPGQLTVEKTQKGSGEAQDFTFEVTLGDVFDIEAREAVEAQPAQYSDNVIKVVNGSGYTYAYTENEKYYASPRNENGGKVWEPIESDDGRYGNAVAAINNGSDILQLSYASVLQESFKTADATPGVEGREKPVISVNGTPLTDADIKTKDDGTKYFEVTAKDGEPAVITGIPNGTPYTVVEKEAKGFTLTESDSTEGVINGGEENYKTAGFTNEPGATLIISKVQIGLEDNAADFPFEVTLSLNDSSDNDLSIEEIAEDILVNGEAPVIEDGKLKVSVKGGEQLEITGIPAGTSYEVTELTSPGFVLESAVNDSGTLKAMEVKTATFVNNPVPADEPEKKVNGVEAYTLANRDEVFTYTITQAVPRSATKMEITDTLVDELEIVDGSWKLYGTRANGDPVETLLGIKQQHNPEQDMASIVVDGQTITATMQDAAGGDDWGTVTLEFQAKIRDEVSDETLMEKYGKAMDIPNKGTVSVNDDPKSTNEVTVNPPQDPEKKINAGTDPVTLTSRPEEFTYTVSQVVPQNVVDENGDRADLVKLAFEDVLVEELEVIEGSASIDVIGADDPVVDQTADGRDRVTATIEDAELLKSLAGQTVTLTFKAKIKDDVTDDMLIAKYGESKQIPNKATVTLNDQPKETNEVLVTPPDNPREDPQKKINGQTDLVTLGARSDVFTYTVSQKMPDDAVSAYFEDIVDDLLEVIPDSATITVEAEGDDSLADATATIAGQKVSAELSKEQAMATRGKVVTLTFQAKLKAGVTDEQILKRNEGTDNEGQVVVPNKGTVTVNDHPATTNEVLVTPPNPQENPEKTVNNVKNDENTPVELEERTSTFEYAVSQKVPANAAKASFSDQLEAVLEYVEGSGTVVLVEVTPAEEEGAEPTVTETPIEADVAYDEATNTVSVTDLDVTGLDGKTVKLVFTAKIKDGVTDTQLIDEYGSTTVPNKAIVIIDGKPNTTNTVYVKPPTPQDEPKKTVSDADETDVKAATLDERSEKFTYKVTQKIPALATTATWEDTLEDVLEVVNYTLVDAEGNAIDGARVTEKRNVVTATLRGNALKPYWDQDVVLVIEAKIKDGVSDADLIAKYGSTDVPNSATVTIDDTAKPSNEVTVTPPPQEDEPVKKINGQTEKVTLKERPEEFTYTVEQYIPANATKVTFEDTLEDVLEVVSADIDGKAEYANETSGNAVKFSAADATADRGTTVTLTIVAKIKADVTDEQLLEKYGNTLDIPNKADITIDDTKKTTNEVLVTPPPEEEEPSKKVNGQDEVTLAERPERFVYTIEQKIPANATTAEFTDELERVLEIVDAKLSVDGGEVTIDEAANTVTATLEGDALKDQWTKPVALIITAKIKDGVSDADLIKLYGSTTIPNKATVAINDKGKPTNTVTVTPPPDEDEPVKKINGQTEKVTLAERSDQFTYTVEQQIPADATTVTFEDTLEDVLEVVSAEIDGKAEYANETSGNAVKFTTADATADRGAKVTLTIKAKIKADVSDADLIAKYGSTDVPNKADVTINDEKKTTNEVLVTPPGNPNPDEPSIEKLVTTSQAAINNKHGDLASIDEVYTYTINTAMPANAKGFEVTDTIDSVLAFDGTATATVDGQAAGTAAVDGQKLTVTFSEEEVAANAGKAIQVVFKAKIAVTDAELVEEYADRTVPNTASYQITNLEGEKLDPKDSNEVTVTPPTPPAKDPEKKINGQKELVNLATRTEEFTYTVSQEIPAGATSATFTDTLERVLEIVGTPTVDAAGAKVAVDGQTVTATLTGDALKDQWTKVVTLTIQAKIKDGITDDQLLTLYGTLNVPNKANVAINGEGKATNEVLVTPPPAPKPTPNEPAIEKLVKTSKADINNVHGDLGAIDEVYTYTINTTMPTNAKAFTVTDTIDSVLAFAGAATVTLDGQAAGTATVSGQTLTVTFTEDEVMNNGRAPIQIVFPAKIAVDDATLVAKYADRTVPNKAQYTITNLDGQQLDPKDSNEVTVTPPTPEPVGSVRVKHVTTDGEVLEDWVDVRKDVAPGTEYTTSQGTFPGYVFVQMDPKSAEATGVVVADTTLDVIYVYKPIESEPVKNINGGTEKVTLQSRPEVFTYTVAQVIPGGAKNVVFSDTLEDVLEFVGTPTIDVDGVTPEVNEQTVTATIADASALWGTTVTLTFQAKIKDGVRDADLVATYGADRNIPNTATVTIDNTPKVTNEVLVTPPTPTRGEDLIPFYATISKKAGLEVATELEGAALRLTTEAGDTWAEWITGAEPWFDYIAPGTYTLTEITAPTGYEIAPPITFTVGTDGIISADSEFVSAANNTVTMVDEQTPEPGPTPPTEPPTRGDDSPEPEPSDSPTTPAPVNPASPTVTKPLVKTGAGVGMGIAMVAMLLAGGGSLLALRRREA